MPQVWIFRPGKARLSTGQHQTIHKSWINKPITIINDNDDSNPAEDALVPCFRPGDIQKLLAARCNMVGYEDGLGYVIVQCLTGAAQGSIYADANDLRVVQFAAKQVRNAAKPFVGEDNDDAGDGVSNLVDAGAKPLKQLKKDKEIFDYVLTGKSDPDDRNLGNVYLRMGLRHIGTMKHIFTNVYLASQE